jgi:hypothetical protein
MNNKRSDILRQKAREIRALARSADAANIRDLLDHLAKQCERLAEQLAQELC